jgi:hypothetical protein
MTIIMVLPILLSVLAVFMCFYANKANAKTRKTVATLAGKFVGGFYILLGVSVAALIVFRAVDQGVIPIGRRSQISFAEHPVIACLVFLVFMVCAVFFVNQGWKILKELRHTITSK